MADRTFAVVNIGQFVPLEEGTDFLARGANSRLGVRDGCAFSFENGLIGHIGLEDELDESDLAGVEVIDAGGRLVTPGLVDAHTHLIFGGNRAAEFEQRAEGASYQEIASSGGGILSTVAKTREASEESLVASGRRHSEWMLRCGTTTAEAKSGYGLDLDSELKMLRAIKRLREEGPLDLVPTFLGAHALPPEYTDRLPEYVQYVISRMLPKVKEEGLAEFFDVFCEEHYFDVDASRTMLEAAKDLGFGIRLHADQMKDSGGAVLAGEVGAKTADHLEHTVDAGIEAMAASGVQPILLPGSVVGLGYDLYPDARAMIDAGLAVVLATDFNPGSSPTPSLPLMMALACRYMRMTPAEALTACTINAAHSLNRGHDRGSLETGKRADFVIWDAEDFREIPYWFGRSPVYQVWIEGSLVFENSQVPQ